MAPAAEHDDTERRDLHLRLCDASYQALAELSGDHGVTVAALIDSMGHSLDEMRGNEWWQDTVRLARRIDAERRRRRPAR